MRTEVIDQEIISVDSMCREAMNPLDLLIKQGEEREGKRMEENFSRKISMGKLGTATIIIVAASLR